MLTKTQVQGAGVSLRKRQAHVFISKLMVGCMVEFVVLQMPMNFVLSMSTVEAENKRFNLQSSTFFLCYIPVAIDAVINPLWLSFISFKSNVKNQGILTSPTGTQESGAIILQSVSHE